MGSVGISFGNPTSGQGFNVSETVSQIVANLQAVETPWKNQLSSFEAQDTALTGIGTDLSTLASALESLTDFDGVLSGKEGSSSDTSIVELTSASAAASAGSHTITVTQLAQTSSYYSSGVAANDKLSGSLAVNGQQISIVSGSNDTLSTLASYINGGDYGVTATVAVNSAGLQQLNLVSTASGEAGDIQVDASLLKDASTPSTTISFNQGQAGQDAEFSVDGLPTRSNPSNTVTNAIPGVTMQLLMAAPDTPVQVEITNDNASVESAVSTFVSAYNTVVHDLSTQEGDDSSGNPEPLFGNPEVATIQELLQEALSFTQPANVLTTNSTIAPSDTLSGSLSIQVGTASAQTVSVPAGNSTLQGLADAINGTANIGVTAAVTTSGGHSTLTLTNSTAGSSGAIVVNAAGLTDATTGSLVTFGQAQSNGVTSLTGLGISANNDGTLSLDSTALESALDNNYQDVINFFEPTSLFTSFGSNLTAALSGIGSSAPSGSVYLALKSDSSEESLLETNIGNENSAISTQQAQLTTELNEANYTLEEIPSQIQEINEMYSAMTGYNENANG